MRNLKKILALVLALMMVLSMMVTASAADFTDAEDIQYAEAVDVMVAAGILSGDGNGNFNPKGTLTRAGAAKLLAYVMLQDDIDLLEQEETNFSDVAADHWASAYINYCANEGLIDGYNGEFNPDGVIDGYGMAKLLLVALGVEGEYTGDNWKLNVATASKTPTPTLTAGLAKTFKLSANLTREAACQMVFNALTCTVDGTVLGYSYDNYADYVFESRTEALIMFKEIVGAEDFDVTKIYEVTDDSTALINNFDVTKVTNLPDDFGRTFKTVWLNADDEVVYAEYVSAKKTMTGTELAMSFLVEDYWENWTGADTVAIHYNGVEVEEYAEGEVLALLLSTGINVEFYGNYVPATKTTVINKVVAYDYDYAVVTDIDEETKNITLAIAGVDPFTVEYDAEAEEQSDNYIALADYAEDTVLAVCYNNVDGLAILDLQVPTTVSGEVTKLVSETVEETTTYTSVDLDGETYYFAANYNGAEVDFDSEGTYYLLNGLILGYADPYYVPEYDFVYVAGVYKTETTGEVNAFTGTPTTVTEYWAQCVNANGETVTYAITKNHYDELKGENEEAVDALKKVSTAYGIDLNNDDMMKDYATLESAEVIKTATYADETVLANTALKITDKQYFTEDVKFVYVYGDKADLEVTVLDGVQALADVTVEYYIVAVTGTENSTVSVVFVEDQYNDRVATGDIVYAAESDTSVTKVPYTNEYGVKVYGYVHTVYINGVKTSITTTSADALSGFISLFPVVEGVYATEANEAANLKAPAAVTNMYNGMLTTNGTAIDKDVTGVTVVNLTRNTKVPTDATKLGTTEEVALVYDLYGNITLIYVTKSTRS